MIKKIYTVAAMAIILSSCAKKLDLYPTNDLTPEKTYSTPDGYKSVLAKIYGTLSITGNNGPSGSPDIAGGLNEGSQVAFIRGFFNCQELPTDEAVVAWNDQTIKDFHDLKWTSSDPFLKGIYARPIYNITLINEYLRESTDEKLMERDITGQAATDIKNSNAEARFLRAFNYWVMMDLFGRSTFINENDPVGAVTPGEKKRDELYSYIISELSSIESALPAAKTSEYGRVDRGAAWALLARIYLNAKTYIGVEKNTEAITYAKKVIDAGYSLHPTYKELFMADNHKCTDEFIFSANCDGLRTQAYGNTTFFVHAAAGDDHDDYGVGGGWYGYRATKALGNKFPDPSGTSDKRAMFVTRSFGVAPDQVEISDIGNFANGLHVNKYRNIRADGAATSDPTRSYSDIDFPIFRLAEMYLIYAEATLRGGTGGDATLALEYVNKLRERAFGNNFFNISSSDLTLDYILDERARELYWEGHRRTDLIRYGLLTSSSYLWPWKGGVSSGTSVDDKYNLFPVPAANRIANPNLTQNPGY